MKVFGKSISEYFAFQKIIMILILVVGITRLALSVAGLPDSIVKWLSLTALSFVGIAYCGIKVPRTGFGGYKHLLPLFVWQAGVANIIIVAGIVLGTLTGSQNIFSRPEYSGPMAGSPWLHALGHLVDGFIVGPLLGWFLGSIVMLVTKKVSPPRA